MSYSKFQQQRIEKGLCKDCGVARGDTGTRVNCRDCADKKSMASTRLKQQARAKFAEGRCRSCGADVIGTGYKACQKCRDNSARYQKRHAGLNKQAKLSAGICLECSQQIYPGAKRCWKHIMDNSLRKFGIPMAEWQSFWLKLESQNFRCFYTGVELRPEDNLSLDHLTPRSKGGSNDLSNCVWCDRNINAFKNDLTLEEFVSRCKTIASRFND